MGLHGGVGELRLESLHPHPYSLDGDSRTRRSKRGKVLPGDSGTALAASANINSSSAPALSSPRCPHEHGGLAQTGEMSKMLSRACLSLLAQACFFVSLIWPLTMDFCDPPKVCLFLAAGPIPGQY